MKTCLMAVAALLTLACAAPKATPPPPPPEPFVPRIALRPLAVNLLRGATQAFVVELNYPEDLRYIREPVTWAVLEPTGGSVTLEGLYTAPATPGTYHVRVTRVDYPTLGATATVTVK